MPFYDIEYLNPLNTPGTIKHVECDSVDGCAQKAFETIAPINGAYPSHMYTLVSITECHPDDKPTTVYKEDVADFVAQVEALIAERDKNNPPA